MSVKNILHHWILLIGTIVIVAVNSMVAFGESEAGFFNSIVANTQMDWNAMFDLGTPGEDMYQFVYQQAYHSPNEKAITEMAKNTGFTTNEIRKINEGSVAVLFQNRPDVNLSRTDANRQMQDFKADFEHLKAMFELQAEVELAVKPKEIFANGDLSDSGFDLVHDLELIEEVLFLKTEDITIGGKYQFADKNPFIGAPNGGINPEGNSEIQASVPDAYDFPNGAVVNIVDAVCVDGEGEDGINDALLNGDFSIENRQNEDIEIDQLIVEGEDIPFDQPDSWIKEWCEGINNPSPYISSTSNESLSGLDFGEPFVESAPFEITAAMCLSISAEMERNNSYLPGQDNCILCELEKINTNLDRTLSHSLIPNKVTGNYGEAGKCKDVNAIGVNLQFIPIWSPIPSPASDDLVFGNNVFEEWDEFVKKTRPLVFESLPALSNNSESLATTTYGIAEYNAGLAATDNRSDFFNELNATADFYTSQAENSYKNQLRSQGLENDKLVRDVLLDEISEMTALFGVFEANFEKTNKEALEEIVKKPNIE